MDCLSQEQLAALSQLVIREPQEALALLREYERDFEGDQRLALSSGGFLIDLGTTLNRLDLTREGIARIESLLDRADKERPFLLYNLANGYSSLASLERHQEGEAFCFDPDNTPLLKAKRCYREAMAHEERLPTDFLAQIWVDYGNCLSGLGRTVEAISAYDRALQMAPEHPMAMGNLGIELHRFAAIAGHAIFLFEARRMLSQALSNPRLEEHGVDARRAFKDSMRRIDEAMSKLDAKPNAQIEHQDFVFSTEYQREYAEFCAKHQLFLNFCLRCRHCERCFRDSVSFSLTTDVNDEVSFVRLARIMNETKERFAAARLLLFQALYPSFDTVPFDEMTSYIDNLDYAVYGERVASLKLAFEGAYNILDKIAHYLNDYLELRIKPGPKVTFATNGLIWHEKDSHVLRARMRGLDNFHLFGLYDIARDLNLGDKRLRGDEYWAKLRRTRNALTHEYLILHIEGMHWTIEADDPANHLHFTGFVEQTIALLQLVRAAIIYLFAFLDEEERKRRHISSGPIGHMYVTPYDASLFSGALKSHIE